MLCKLGKCKSIPLPKQFFTFIFYLVHTEKIYSIVLFSTYSRKKSYEAKNLKKCSLPKYFEYKYNMENVYCS